MIDFFREVSSFFGPTPTDDIVYGGHYNEFDHHDEEHSDGSYTDSYCAECHHYKLREEAPHKAANVNSHEEDYRYGKLHSVAGTKEPEQVPIEPENGFQDRYSKAPDIGSHPCDGDVVAFDLSEPNPSETKRYVDFVAELVFGLCDQTKADGSVFTLYPHGRDVSKSQLSRMSGQLVGAHGLLVFRISINQLGCLFVPSLPLALLILLKLFTYLLLAHTAAEMIRSFSHFWRLGEVSSSIGKVIFIITNLSVKLLRQLIPLIPIGNVMANMSMLVLFFILIILRTVLQVALSAVA